MSLCLVAAGCCGPNSSSSCQNTRIGPSGAEVAGVVIAAGAVVGLGVALEVNHSHHTLKGCVSSGQSGLELEPQGEKKMYALAGDTANIKAGDLVKLHGTRLKKAKNSTGDQAFSVEKLSKDYGPCKQTP